MNLARSFPPLAGPDAKLLILGSMPGLASLAAQRYYAHPRNAFWPIMGELVGANPEFAYEQRVAALLAAGIAVWDVLEACIRPGSLDTSIRRDGLVANDFATFLAAQPGISRICFNGAKAAQLFESMVLPSIPQARLPRQTLPSTSPANASLRYAEKLAAWRSVIDPTLQEFSAD
jgi:hypoxanthine-DNA glycosylase